MKKVQVNTPLILEQNGEMVRIETGQIIELTDDVYAQVSAHTTLLDEMSDEPVFKPADDVGGDAVSDEVVTSDAPTDSEAAEPKKSTRKKA